MHGGGHWRHHYRDGMSQQFAAAAYGSGTQSSGNGAANSSQAAINA
jgi:hypothetical protein